VYVGTLGMMYIAVSSGAIGGADVMSLVEKLGAGEHIPADISPKSSSFLIAWVATKLTEPPRLALTLLITPYIARMLGFTKKGAVPAKVAADLAKQVAEKVKHIK